MSLSTPASEQRAAVITALAANVAIAVAKFGASAITGSSAMLAESLHSLADSVNEILLLVGARRSREPADARHPFGHGRYRYVYAFLVSLTVFWIGGVLAVIEGVSHLAAHESLVDPRWAFAVLVLAAILEGWSLRTTVRAGRPTKGALSWRRFIQLTKAPEIIVVFLEDLGALAGIGLALIGVGLTTVTSEGAWDALASIAIGILLMSIGLLVNRETQSLLVGESAAVEVVAAIREAIASTDGVEAVVDLRTIHVGPDDLVIAAKISVVPSETAAGIARSIVDAEARVRRVAPFRTVIYLEPRLREPGPDDASEPSAVGKPTDGQHADARRLDSPAERNTRRTTSSSSSLEVSAMTVTPSDPGSPASSPSPAPAPSAGSFTLTSTAFAEGDAIPREFSCDGANVSPPLSWTGVPAGAAALVLVVDDPDARGYVHWIVLDLPGRDGGLPKGVDPTATSPRQGGNGWRGPCPPSGTHHYVFALRALGAPLNLADHPASSAVQEALAGATVVGTATLTGTYRRSRD